MIGGTFESLTAIWVYLAATPLIGLTLTLVAYLAGTWLQRRAGGSPLANPVLIAVALLAGVMLATGTAYETYFAGAQFVHFLLGPATVALAVPLYRQLKDVRRAAPAILGATLFGSVFAALSGYGLALLVGAAEETARSVAPKAITTPIAMGVAERIGGLPSLAAVVVILNGILGAVVVSWVLNRTGIKDWRARGFAAGLAASGIGTARAMQVHPQAGAFAALALGLNALATALLLPLLMRLVG
ncbi:MAG: LrgB family protein [Alphaproteobacteria bacterium]|nr:LrgB family protein [Alphaproteobacteria bacterium]